MAKLKFDVNKSRVWVSRPTIDCAVDNLGKIIWKDDRFIFVVCGPEFTRGSPRIEADELMQIAGKVFQLTQKKMRSLYFRNMK